MSENQSNDGEKMVIRNEKGQVVSGVLNPKGKEKGTRHFTTIVQEALLKLGTTATGDKIEVQKALGEKVVKMALEGNEQMIKLIWNYLDGLPKATLDIDTPDETKDILKGILDKMNGIKPE
jgi:hypothetical protein